MSTYRERREARAERLADWADKREAKGTAEVEHARAMFDVIPFGQPMMPDHYSYGRDRNYRARAGRTYDRGFENLATAERMREKAANIARQAEHAIYTDDADACERLAERIAGLEAEREACKQANAAYRKAHPELRAMTAYQRNQAVPFPSYHLENLSGSISRQRARLALLERQAAAPAGTVTRRVVNRRPGTCSVCAETVDAGAGLAEKADGEWSVRHAGCDR